MVPKGVETEKKLLIKYPDTELLVVKCAVKKDIVQTYLSAPEGVSERVRSSTTDGATVFTHTIKKKLTAMSRSEDEEEISRERYEELLLRADPACAPIRKTRYVLRGEKHIYEFDIFPFWTDKAFLEVELSSEDEAFSLPDFVEVLADVTTDGRFTNHALARRLRSEF